MWAVGEDKVEITARINSGEIAKCYVNVPGVVVGMDAVAMEEFPRSVVAMVGRKNLVMMHVPSGKTKVVDVRNGAGWYGWLVEEGKRFEKECAG